MNREKTHNQSRRERDRQRHRDEILMAAESVFAEKGYDPATIEEIARVAEFSVGSLYKFFDGKQDLFLAVADRILDDLLERFETEVLALRGNPRRAIESYIAMRLDEVTRHDAFMHVYYPSMVKKRYQSGSARRDDERLEKIRRFRIAANELFQLAIDRGVLRSIPAQDLLAIVEGSVRFFAKTWMCAGADKPSEEERWRIIERSLLALLWA